MRDKDNKLVPIYADQNKAQPMIGGGAYEDHDLLVGQGVDVMPLDL